jgi:glycoside/pentoside/hexuronide:cation symporter, GPH family
MYSLRLPTNWLVYSSGFLGLFLINNALLSMLLFRYDPGDASSLDAPVILPSALVGLAMFLGRLMGAVSQPMLGYWSDNFNSVWGKRRPFLALGSIPVVASFGLVFLPLFRAGPTFNLLYLIVLLCIFYQAFAVYQVSYLAWLPTHAKTSSQRVMLSTVLAVTSLLGALIAGVATPWLTYQYGFKTMVLAISTLSLVTLLIPLSLREKPTLSGIQREILLRESFFRSLRNPVFLPYALGISTAWVAIGILSITSTFIAVALLGYSIGFAAVVNGLVLLGSVLGLPFVLPLVKRYGKKRTFQGSMAWSGFGLIGLALLPLIGSHRPILLLGLLMISSLGLAGFYVLPNAMLPDVIDQNRKDNGAQQEAIYFGVRGLLVEFSVGLGFLISGLMLALGNTATNPLGVQIAIAVAGFFSLLSVVVFRSYSIEN